jgi:hypothetical protein
LQHEAKNPGERASNGKKLDPRKEDCKKKSHFYFHFLHK